MPPRKATAISKGKALIKSPSKPSSRRPKKPSKNPPKPPISKAKAPIDPPSPSPPSSPSPPPAPSPPIPSPVPIPEPDVELGEVTLCGASETSSLKTSFGRRPRTKRACTRRQRGRTRPEPSMESASDDGLDPLFQTNIREPPMPNFNEEEEEEGETVAPAPTSSAKSQAPPVLEDIEEENDSEDVGDDNKEEGVLRVRLKTKFGADGKPIKAGRGVCNGAALEAEVRMNKGRLSLERESNNTPKYGKWRSLLSHAIGLYVKESLRMDVECFGHLGVADLQGIIDHLSAFFIINPEDKWLEEFIIGRAAARFREWKCYCHKFFKEHGEAQVPYEFRSRLPQWQALCAQFKSPVFMAKSNRLKETRKSDKRVSHSAGKTPFGQIAKEYEDGGEKAPLLAAITKVYKNDPKGKEVAEKISKSLHELQHERSEVGSTDELSIDDQYRIIEAARGKRKQELDVAGTSKRPRAPKGGLASSFIAYKDLEAELRATKEALEKEREDMEAFKRSITATLSNLEDHVRKLSSTVPPETPAPGSGEPSS